MLNYLKGLFFIILFIFFINGIGKKILKKEELFIYNIIIGYITYCVIQFIGAFISTVLLKSYTFYMVYMICFVIIVSAYLLKQINLKNLVNDFIDHFKKYFLIYIMAFILVCFSLLNVEYLWQGNNLDDGYYIMKIANMSKYNSFQINYTNGFFEHLSFVRMINTYEMDYSFWVNILHISPVIFCKVIISYFNYVFYITSFLSLYCFMNKINKDNITWKISFILLPILLFCLTQTMLVKYNIIWQQDSWHFSNAAFYGSTFVRCVSIPVLLFVLLFFNTFKQKGIYFIMACIMLFSKASQALPIISIFCISYIFTYGLIELMKLIKNNKKILIIIVLMCLYIVMSFVLEKYVSVSLKEAINIQVSYYFQSPLNIISIIIMLCGLFFGYTNMKKIVIFFMVIHLCVFVPCFNDLFLLMSQYTFVVGRTITALSFSMFLIAVMILYKLSVHFLRNVNIILTLYLTVAISFCGLYLYDLKGTYGIKSTVRTLIENKYLIPNVTLELSSKLEDICQKNKRKETVISPLWTVENSVSHGLGVFLMLNAPDIYNLSVLDRYPIEIKEGDFVGFSIEDKNIFENFNAFPEIEENQNNILMLLKKYPIDILIINNEKSKDWLLKHTNYVLEDQCIGSQLTYYILKKE